MDVKTRSAGFVAILALYWLSLSNQLADSAPVSEWESFKKHYNKSYESIEEELCRLKIYHNNKILIEKHNILYSKKIVLFKLKINHLSDKAAEKQPPLNEMQFSGVLECWYYNNRTSQKCIVKNDVERDVEKKPSGFQAHMLSSWWTDPTPASDELQLKGDKTAKRNVLRHQQRGRYSAHRSSSPLEVQHKKAYSNEDEEKERFDIFKENKKKIDEHNEKYEKGEVTWKMGLNAFSDLKPEEFKGMMGGVKKPN
ncbi:hypothetical protein AAG570_011231 [Ranatra chinensis]|uniref:Cathepsin propeptide inhibitor domain-containing protein n=1 Tax=Ranatra chinensis TaxID=642074 RepID=A0ABD0YYC3_9HEMI